jgi:hypothetical protein
MNVLTKVLLSYGSLWVVKGTQKADQGGEEILDLRIVCYDLLLVRL